MVKGVIKINNKRVPNSIVTIFGFSELTALLFATISTNYFGYYLTDVALLSAASMGTLLLIGRIGDVVTLLLSGIVEESTMMKWGKYRSWLLIATPLAAIAIIFQYTNINFSVNFKFIYFVVFYIVSYGLFNFGRTSQLALLNAFGNTQEERLRLSARKAQFASVSRIIFGATFMPLVLIIASGATEATGFLLAVMVFSVVYLVPQLILFKVSKEYDKPDVVSENKNKVNLTGREMFEQIFRNPPLLLIMVAETMKSTMNTVVLGMASYYFKYVIGSMAMISVFVTAVSIATFVGAIAGQPIAKKVGKKNLYLISLGGTVVFLVLARIFGGNNGTVFMILSCMAFFIFAFIAVIGPAMFSDCIEYGKYKIGKEARAFIMSMYTLPIKIGVAIAGAVTGYGLAALGYSANVEVTPAVAGGIFNLITIIPAAILAIGFIAMLFYKLTDERVNEIMEMNRQQDVNI